jgi:hypothetical protein
MMAFVELGIASGRLAALVDVYAQRVYPAVLDQHAGASVSSPLGVWLLLAACASGARGVERLALEDALGCPVEEASDLLRAFTGSMPDALRAAIAVWVAVADRTEALASWVRGLPPAVESGFMPTQAEADAWADRNTDGLIRFFPLDIDEYTRIVLSSALATKVSWQAPFELVPADEHLGLASPWRGSVERLLWDGHPGGHAMIVDTRAAGLVAVHRAIANQDLTVVSVSAEPDADREAVLAAAHEVIAAGHECSLFDVPVGSGHSWLIEEREVRAFRSGDRVERIAGVSLPAWHVKSRLELAESSAFGSSPAIQAMRLLIGPLPDDASDAVQVAVASFTRYGFEAAAVTAFGVRTAAMAPMQQGIERTAVLRFDHPYAAIAVVGRPSESPAPFSGLPLFTAWIHEPSEARAEPEP